jgi:hypothetical protein
MSNAGAAVLVVTALAVCAGAWSCGRPGGYRTLLPPDLPATPALRAACAVAERKCTRCHSLDRVLVAQVMRPKQWEIYVGRMRRMTASGITAHDAPPIVRCLVYRSFGVPDWVATEETEQKEEPRERVTSTE